MVNIVVRLDGHLGELGQRQFYDRILPQQAHDGNERSLWTTEHYKEV